VVLHIGTEKTGTTTLQEVLTRAAGDLEATGVHYLTTPDTRAARDLAAAAVGDGWDEYLDGEIGVPMAERPAFATGVVDRVAREAARLDDGIHTVLVSSEHFSSRLTRNDQVAALAEMVAPLGDRTEIVCYLRPQWELVTSHYSTRLRVGETRTLEEVARDILRPGHPYVDYRGLLERYADVFGDDGIHVRIYDRDQLVGGDIVTDFADVVGLDATLLTSVELERLNTSISASGQHLLRELNHHRDEIESPQEASAVVRSIAQAFRGPGERLSDATIGESESHFAADNEALRARWRPDLGALFPPRPPTGSDRAAVGTPSRTAALEAHVAELKADVEWLNDELGRRPVAAVRKLMRRPPSRLRADR
jgi:hypothetical protein